MWRVVLMWGGIDAVSVKLCESVVACCTYPMQAHACFAGWVYKRRVCVAAFWKQPAVVYQSDLAVQG